MPIPFEHWWFIGTLDHEIEDDIENEHDLQNEDLENKDNLEFWIGFGLKTILLYTFGLKQNLLKALGL